MAVLTRCADWAVPLCLLFAGAILFRRPSAWEAYLRGAKQGLSAAVSLLPAMVLLMVSLSVFTSSGACGWIAEKLSPVTDRLGIPAELLPLCILRPLSGSASGAYLSTLFGEVGADSIAGMAASILAASGDTVLYVIGMYYSVTRVRRTRFSLPVAFAVSIFSIFLSCILARLFV